MLTTEIPEVTGKIMQSVAYGFRPPWLSSKNIPIIIIAECNHLLLQPERIINRFVDMQFIFNQFQNVRRFLYESNPGEDAPANRFRCFRHSGRNR